MGVILKIALRNMKRRKLRYILTTITLIISVALFGGVMIVSDSFKVMMLDTIDKQMGTADILIRSANSTNGWFEPYEINSQIENVKHVESIAYRIAGFNVYASATNSGNQVDNSTRIGIYGIDPQDADERKLGGKPYIIDSVSNKDTIEELLEYIDVNNGNNVTVISESLKIQLGSDFQAGDSVWILPNEGELLGFDPRNTGTWLEYTVVAIIRDIGEARDFDPENPSESTMFSQGAGIFASINNTHTLVDGTENHTGEYNLGVVGVDDIYSVSSVTKKIESNLDELNDGRDWKVNDLKSDSLDMINTTMTTLETVFLMFGLIALILSIILMWNIFNIIKKEQEYETGMFQAIGASKSETFRMFLTQGAVMGIIGALIGTICSYFISYVIFSVTLQTIQSIASQMGGFTISEFNIVLYPTTIITTFVIGLISCIIASLYPSWKASRKPIIECLNPIEEKSKREKKHIWKRLIFFILGGLLIIYGIWLMISEPEATAEIQTTPGPSQGMVVSMFAPILILFGIIWILALSIKPLNKAFVVIFSPYLRKTKLLTEKNILRHRKRTTLTFTMIALTTSFLIGMSVMMDSIRAGVTTTVNDFMGSNIRVYTYNTPKSFEVGLLNQTGVDDVMGASHQNAQIQIDGDWIGHSLLDSEWNESITINVIDSEKVKEHMTKTEIVSPKGMTLSEMMDEIEIGDKIVIDEKFANDYNIKVADNITVKFSLGTTYANLTALLYQNGYNAHEETIIVNMSVIAIIQNIQGFSTLNLMGFLSQGKIYNMFISWGTYEEIASKNLPGGGTDLVFRQVPQTGDPTFNSVMPNWFNFSTIETIMNNISGIEYYTTRMDYYTSSYNGSDIDYMTSVVGIHTISNGTLKSDSFFGNNTLVEQQFGYEGSTMEEILNITTKNVCVVDETFIKNHPSVKIGDNISIFPLDSPPSPPDTWPKFEIIGIIEAPTYNNTEKYNWKVGGETGFDIGGNSVYINYEKARNLIYANYMGSNYFNDNITSVLVHCKHPANITTSKNVLEQNLYLSAWGNWSIVDINYFGIIFQDNFIMRTNVYDWFVWVEKGVYDENVLKEVVNYIENRGYLIIFGFTKSFMISTFRTMINLIVFITNGLLIFAIIIAMIGLTLHSLLSTMARRREIGMLRSIGLNKKGVIRSISGETLILALLGVFTGIFAGIIQGTLMVNSMPAGGFLTVTWTIPWLTIVILVATVLVTVILSSRYPAKWAANLNIIDAVRTR